jgi:1-hydroxy-2-naphthoate dioxygenase
MDDTRTDRLDDLNRRLDEANLRGQWKVALPLEGPTPSCEPHVWHYDDVLAYALEACEALPETEHARRSLMFRNPTLGRDITHTLGLGIQLIQPGEIAWPHRHTASAIRFVIDGSPDLVTVVDRTAYPMEPYDLVLTPNWCWHGHHNRSEKNVTWLDILDLPAILSLNQLFYEPGEIGLIEPDGTARMEPPAGERENARPYPGQMRFAWADMEARLREAAAAGEADPFDGVTREYTQPETGGPTIPTVHCRAHLLPPGTKTKRHRHSTTAAYFVVGGEGRSVIGDRTVEWAKHDTFCVPNWSWHAHENIGDTDVLLFSVDDSPVMAAFDLVRSEAADD